MDGAEYKDIGDDDEDDEDIGFDVDIEECY